MRRLGAAVAVLYTDERDAVAQRRQRPEQLQRYALMAREPGGKALRTFIISGQIPFVLQKGGAIPLQTKN